MGPAAWRNGLNFPVHVPTELVAIRVLLSAGRVSDTCTELWRLVQLGSDPAAALLGFISFRGVDWKEVGDNQILDRCRQAAFRGNSYAQYVMALHERTHGDYSKAWPWLNMSNMKEFGPSLAESGRIAAGVVGKPEIALPYLARGFRAYHLPSLVFFLSLCIRGSYGFLWRIFGVTVYPIAISAMSIGVWYFPYSINVFAHFSNRAGPLFGK
jgi:hypothetical protein